MLTLFNEIATFLIVIYTLDYISNAFRY